MAVYREGFQAISVYNLLKSQIWNDACDEGVVSYANDQFYQSMHQVAQMYGDKSTRKETPDGVEVAITLIDEWAVSDERKTLKEATEKYKISYFRFTMRNRNSLIQKGRDGFFNIEKIN